MYIQIKSTFPKTVKLTVFHKICSLSDLDFFNMATDYMKVRHISKSMLLCRNVKTGNIWIDEQNHWQSPLCYPMRKLGFPRTWILQRSSLILILLKYWSWFYNNVIIQLLSYTSIWEIFLAHQIFHLNKQIMGRLYVHCTVKALFDGPFHNQLCQELFT